MGIHMFDLMIRVSFTLGLGIIGYGLMNGWL
jgi:hypothetical protein